MRWPIVRELLAHELRLLLRDRRTVIVSLVVPLLTMPAMLLALKVTRSRVDRSKQETTWRYALAGPPVASFADAVHAALARSGDARRFAEVEGADPLGRLREKQLDLVLEPAGPWPTPGEAGPAAAARRLPVVRASFRADQDRSRLALSAVEKALAEERERRRGSALRQAGFRLEAKEVLPVQVESVASAAESTGSSVGRYAVGLLIGLMIMGGSVVAADIVAGEKERGTLETLLTTAVHRDEVLAGKQLAIAAVAGVITLVQLGNLLFYVTLGLIELPADFALVVPPSAILALGLLLLPLAALVAAVLLAISARSSTYKEVQLFFLPLFLLAEVPAFAAALPGVQARSALAFVPIANVSVAAREVLAGRTDWLAVLLAASVTGLCAALVVRSTARLLSDERRVLPARSDEGVSGPERFQRVVGRWFAVMWTAAFVGAPILSLDTVREQVAFNIYGVMLVGSLLMVRVYRLDPRQAFAVRAPRPEVWLGVVLIAVCGYFVGLAVYFAAFKLLPVPPEVLEQFSNMVLDEGMSFPEMLLLISISPGIIEELTFRGVLLHGMRRRFRPLGVALAVGGIFGLFHVALFRLVPTAFLGVLLTVLTMWTGSIFPAMAAHGMNNALATILGRAGFALDSLPAGVFALFALGLATGFWVVWRHRTLYPGLKQG